jgi:hypothetical protein
MSEEKKAKGDLKKVSEQTLILKERLSPSWLLECVMYDERHNALVISPKHCLEHGITVLEVAQDSFAGRTILHFRLDYNIKKVKKERSEGGECVWS